MALQLLLSGNSWTVLAVGQLATRISEDVSREFHNGGRVRTGGALTLANATSGASEPLGLARGLPL